MKPRVGASCHIAAGDMVGAQSAGRGLQSWAGVSAGRVVRGAIALAQGGHLSCGLPFVGNNPARVGNASPGPVSPLPVSALQGKELISESAALTCQEDRQHVRPVNTLQA